MAKMSLGKGLDALFPPNVNVNSLGDKVENKEVVEAGETIIEMKINSVEPNVNQPRKNFDDDKIDEMLNNKSNIKKTTNDTIVSKVFGYFIGN